MRSLERITFDDKICSGKACIRGMRWPVEVLLEMLASGMTNKQILDDHPELEIEDIRAALLYASLSVSGFKVYN